VTWRDMDSLVLIWNLNGMNGLSGSANGHRIRGAPVRPVMTDAKWLFPLNQSGPTYPFVPSRVAKMVARWLHAYKSTSRWTMAPVLPKEVRNMRQRLFAAARLC
jgi:hypothetical protein